MEGVGGAGNFWRNNVFPWLQGSDPLPAPVVRFRKPIESFLKCK